MSQDGTRAVLGSGFQVQVWNAASKDSRWLGVLGAAEEGSEGQGIGKLFVRCLAITADGKYAAAGGCQLTDTYQPTGA